MRVFVFDDVTIEIASFTVEHGVAEHHAIYHVKPSVQGFAAQFRSIIEAEKQLLSSPEMAGMKAIAKRYLLSDAANQLPVVEEITGTKVDNCDCNSNTAYIQQQPLDGSKVALWAYYSESTEHNGYHHYWTMGLCNHLETSYLQTEKLLIDYQQWLLSKEIEFASECIRTWFYVRDVDTQYRGLVVARRENFTRHNLTADTHYIASTGIGGTPAPTDSIVQMDAYAISGLDEGQQQYLYAPTHLNPTHEYGVTFERGTAITYGDRRHVFISGTASINNKGEVVHVGDIVSQTKRMWENVSTLLAEAECDFSNVMHIIVYIRDTADYTIVKQLFDERFGGNTPFVITLAPVCRPAWLIEMECIAVKEWHNSKFRDF